MKRTVCLLLSLFLAACSSSRTSDCGLTRISIVDRNGLSQTISTPDRLARYSDVDFLSPSPYKKVTQVFARNGRGQVPTTIIVYHPNGQPSQYLETLDSRALGAYKEWHDNGQLKLDVRVIGGPADISSVAASNWVFDGLAQAWDRQGRLLTRIPYSRGALDGQACYFHPNGQLARSVPYEDGAPHGVEQRFNTDGTLVGTFPYVNGLQHGRSELRWPDGQNKAITHYEHGRLLNGSWFSVDGRLVSSVVNGEGYEAEFSNDGILLTLNQIQQGQPEGRKVLFNEQGMVTKTFCHRGETKHGPEETYHPNTRWDPDSTRPVGQVRMRVQWYSGVIQGLAETWYNSGQMESRREMSDNELHGVATAWYQDGSLMLVEEYSKGRLVRGEYHRQGDSHPVTSVIGGTGTATIFDEWGQFVKKVDYYQGLPQT